MQIVAASWLLSILAAAGISAAPFSDLIVFGDSLSDVGNVAQASFGIYPGRYYHDDRFTNGPVWVETLSLALGLPPVERSTAGGDNFAYGGAQTTGTGGLEGLFIRDIDEQVTQFLDARVVDPKALFVVFAGSNDFIGGQSDAQAPAASLAEDVGRLIAAGARQFLVPNLPLLGLTPRFNNSASVAAEYNARSQSFNAAVDSALDSFATAHSGLTFHRLDVAGLFTEAIASPAAYGLKNVTDAAAPGLEPGAASYNTSLIAPNAHEYLFWDDLHPTATVHEILATRAKALLAPIPGDFNADGAVDAGDLAAWTLNFGATANATRAQGDADADRDVDGADLLAWQRHSGGSPPGPVGAIPAPEPPAVSIAILLLTMLAPIRRTARAKRSSTATARKKELARS